MSKSPYIGRVTKGFVFSLITTIWLCFKMISFWSNIWRRSQKAYKKKPITKSRVHFTNVTCEGLTRQDARRASPDSLVERLRSGITCFIYTLNYYHLFSTVFDLCIQCLVYLVYLVCSEFMSCMVGLVSKAWFVCSRRATPMRGQYGGRVHLWLYFDSSSTLVKKSPKKTPPEKFSKVAANLTLVRL